MKDFEWRERFAPNGYWAVRQHVSMETLESAQASREILPFVLEDMALKLEKDCPYLYDPSTRTTLLTVWPKDVGEDVNHLDPLRPRLAIEIELRQPVL